VSRAEFPLALTPFPLPLAPWPCGLRLVGLVSHSLGATPEQSAKRGVDGLGEGDEYKPGIDHSMVNSRQGRVATSCLGIWLSV
jgi:hypothetical protein